MRGTRRAGRTVRRCRRAVRNRLPLGPLHIDSTAALRRSYAWRQQFCAHPMSAIRASATAGASELEGVRHADLRLRRGRWPAAWPEDHPGRSDAPSIRFSSSPGYSVVQCELRHAQCVRHPNRSQRRKKRHRLQSERLHARDDPRARATRGRLPLRIAHRGPGGAGVETPTAHLITTDTRDR
jgi:hypothetical protein